MRGRNGTRNFYFDFGRGGDSGFDADADADADSDADPHADADAHADADSHADPDACAAAAVGRADDGRRRGPDRGPGDRATVSAALNAGGYAVGRVTAAPADGHRAGSAIEYAVARLAQATALADVLHAEAAALRPAE